MRVPRRATCLRWVGTIAVACTGATAAVITLERAEALVITANVVLAAIAVGTGLGVVRDIREQQRDIREQQRRIIRQLETQARVMHNAARLAAREIDERR